MADRQIGTFMTRRWGNLHAIAATYGAAGGGPLAVLLEDDFGERIATLSVNMYRPECSRDSTDLPEDCFYVKTWGGQEEIAADALASGVFKTRPDLPVADSGFVSAEAWQIVPRAERKRGAEVAS